MIMDLIKANLYRTATTIYPCFFPDLGDSIGAGRTDLQNKFKKKSRYYIIRFNI